MKLLYDLMLAIFSRNYWQHDIGKDFYRIGTRKLCVIITNSRTENYGLEHQQSVERRKGLQNETAATIELSVPGDETRDQYTHQVLQRPAQRFRVRSNNEINKTSRNGSEKLAKANTRRGLGTFFWTQRSYSTDV